MGHKDFSTSLPPWNHGNLVVSRLRRSHCNGPAINNGSNVLRNAHYLPILHVPPPILCNTLLQVSLLLLMQSH